ncbi:MAG: DUF885 family protein, partial [Bifidobacteriaceae bacterium]|nr:DUF885 family protein [Bifidobacteriaceae bacterium]
MIGIDNSKNAKISEIDKLCNEYFFESLKLEPENAVMFHLENKINKPNNYSDYSPKGRNKALKIYQKYLDKAKKQNSGNFREEIVRQQFIETLSLALETEEKFLDSYRFMNNLFSPFQSFRMIFDLMSKESAQDFEAIFARLDNIPKAVRGYIKSLQKGIEIGVVNTVRQCQLVI